LAALGLQFVQTIAICWLCWRYADLRRVAELDHDRLNRLFTFHRTEARGEQLIANVEATQIEYGHPKGWSDERRLKYMATIAAKKRARQEGGPAGRSGE
jgi:hypothetical protein